MKFTEKLAKLTEGKNKQKLGEDAGLPQTAISNYISKGNVPRVDSALALARALNVPLEWLVDDEQDWPPPSGDTNSLTIASDDDLMREVCRRFRMEALRVVDGLDQAKETNWKELAETLRKSTYPLPPSIARLARVPASLHAALLELHRFDPSQESYFFHDQLPGRNLDPNELTTDRLEAHFNEFEIKEPAFYEVEKLFHTIEEKARGSATRGGSSTRSTDEVPPKKTRTRRKN
jgi:transcriptional regulator with XRE-family HTH domain